MQKSYKNLYFKKWMYHKLVDRGCSVKWACEKAGISRQVIYNITNGHVPINKKHVILLCYVFDCIGEVEDVWAAVREEYANAKP